MMEIVIDIKNTIGVARRASRKKIGSIEVSLQTPTYNNCQNQRYTILLHCSETWKQPHKLNRKQQVSRPNF